VPNKEVVTGTVDLDAEWLHENGPGAIICPALAKMCKIYPGVFEFVVTGCGGVAKNPGCSAQAQKPDEDQASSNAVFYVRSKDHSKKTVAAAFKEVGMVSFRDYISANRRGINALRQQALAILDWS